MAQEQVRSPVPVFIFMGTCGCGKTTIAAACKKIVNCELIEGDELHPQANVDKMSKGIPLQDEDRWSWLASIRDTFVQKASHLYEDPKVDENSPHRAVFVTCSALRKAYRDILSAVNSAKVTVTFVYLKGSPELLQSRMAGRSNHFMHENMLKSQLATLEEPDESTENVIVARIDPPTDVIAKNIVNAAKERKLIYID